MPFIKIDNLSTGEILRVKNANFDKNSVFRVHYLAKPELGDQVKYEKIILQWGTINFKSNFHGIFPHLLGIRPQKFNVVKNFAIFSISWHFSQDIQSHQSHIQTNISQILAYLHGGLQEM